MLVAAGDLAHGDRVEARLQAVAREFLSDNRVRVGGNPDGIVGVGRQDGLRVTALEGRGTGGHRRRNLAGGGFGRRVILFRSFFRGRAGRTAGDGEEAERAERCGGLVFHGAVSFLFDARQLPFD